MPQPIMIAFFVSFNLFIIKPAHHYFTDFTIPSQKMNLLPYQFETIAPTVVNCKATKRNIAFFKLNGLKKIEFAYIQLAEMTENIISLPCILLYSINSGQTLLDEVNSIT